MTQWYYQKGSARFGPISKSELKRLLVSGELAPGDLVCSDDITEWISAAQVDGLLLTDPTAKKVDAIFADLLGPKPAPQSQPRPVASPAPPPLPPQAPPAPPILSVNPAPFGFRNDRNPYAGFTPASPPPAPQPYNSMAGMSQQDILALAAAERAAAEEAAEIERRRKHAPATHRSISIGQDTSNLHAISVNRRWMLRTFFINLFFAILCWLVFLGIIFFAITAGPESEEFTVSPAFFAVMMLFSFASTTAAVVSIIFIVLLANSLGKGPAACVWYLIACFLPFGYFIVIAVLSGEAWERLKVVRY